MGGRNFLGLLLLACATSCGSAAGPQFDAPIVGHWEAARAPTIDQLASHGAKGVSLNRGWFGWGGQGIECPPTTYCSIGGIYDRSTDSWTATTKAGAPSGRQFHSVTLTSDARVLVWGGMCGVSSTCGDGALFEPGSGSWKPISGFEAPSPRYAAFAAPVGNLVIIWGGYKLVGSYGVALGDGFSFDPAADSWKSLPSIGAPSPRAGAAIAVALNRLFVWGGSDSDGTPLGDGAVYDPVTETWEPIDQLDSPSSRFDQVAVGVGDEVFILGGRGCGRGPVGWNLCEDAGFIYNLRTRLWRRTSSGLRPRSAPVATWTGKYVFIFGGSGTCCEGDGCVCTDGALYEPASDSWYRIDASGAPRGASSATWIGDSIFVITDGGVAHRYFL